MAGRCTGRPLRPTVVVTDPSEEVTTMEFPYCPQATHAELANRFDRLVRAGRRRRTRRPARR